MKWVITIAFFIVFFSLMVLSFYDRPKKLVCIPLNYGKNVQCMIDGEIKLYSLEVGK